VEHGAQMAEAAKACIERGWPIVILYGVSTDESATATRAPSTRILASIPLTKPGLD